VDVLKSADDKDLEMGGSERFDLELEGLEDTFDEGEGELVEQGVPGSAGKQSSPSNPA